MARTTPKRPPRNAGRKARRPAGVALVMVLLVLTALAIIGTPFVLSMLLQERSSVNFEGAVRARLAAEAARNHAVGGLGRTVRAREAEEEAADAGILTRTRGGSLAPARQNDLRRIQASRKRSRPQRGMIIREDILGRDARRDRDRGRRGSFENPSGIGYLTTSRKGPAPSTWDAPEELSPQTPAAIEVPASAPRGGSTATPPPPAGAAGSASGSGGDILLSLRDPRGITASARVEDEQGKIHLDTAPPHVIASLFAASVLVGPLRPGSRTLDLEDAAAFVSDGDPQTVDGAVVVVHPTSGRTEAIAYRVRRGNRLEECFRGAFFSIPSRGEFPRGSFVYDLRGWKVGWHKLRAEAVGGFSPTRLAEFPTVEAVREIANWQIADFFLARIRGEGLTADFLARQGIKLDRLEKLGLDRAFFDDSGAANDPVLERELAAAEEALRAKRISGSFIDRLRESGGARAVIAFAAQVGPLDAREATALRKKVEKGLREGARREPKLDRDYVEASLELLAEVYRRPGIETIRPDDLKLIRDAVTVSSTAPTRWSEPQVSPDRILAGDPSGESYRAARPGEHGGGAIVRISSRSNPGIVEYNQTIHRGGNIPVIGFSLLFPVTHSFSENDAVVQFLQRHPVNVNTASPRVLRAVFTGVAGYERRYARREDESERRREDGDADEGTPGVVTPVEATRLAAHIDSRRPLTGPEDLWSALVEAAEAEVIEPDDVRPLFINAIQPNHHMLRVGTMGLCYDSGDVYTIESRGILRSPSGSELTHAAMREIVEVSPARPVQLTLFTQWDFTSEVFLSEPFSPAAPEDHAFHSVGLPGTRGHLVRTTPILYKGRLIRRVSPSGLRGSTRESGIGFERFPIPGAENGTLRLEIAETPDGDQRLNPTLYHFRDTPEGLELPGGEPWALDISGGGGAAATGAAGQGALGVGDLTTVPAAVEAWVRFRTFPQETNHEGHHVIMDAGVERERNRISLLYDSTRSEWIARIWDSSVRDPSIPEGKQYFQVRARRPLDLDTWYHVRLGWNGAYSGGIELSIDGLPVGVPNYVAELRSGIAASGGGNLSFKPLDPEFDFPRVGAARVNNEVFEYQGGGGGGGAIRRQDPSDYLPWRRQEETRIRALYGGQASPQPGGTFGAPGAGAGPVGGAQTQQAQLMRGPWNQRANAPAEHAAGSTVQLHGYSIVIGRKLDTSAAGVGVGEHQAQGNELVWGPGGLSVAEELLPWSFPPGQPGSTAGEVRWISDYHHHPFPQPVGTGGGGGAPPPGGATGVAANTHIAPVFKFRYRVGDLLAYQNVLSPVAFQNLTRLDAALQRQLGGAGGVPGSGGPGGGAAVVSLDVYATMIRWSATGGGRSQYLASEFFQSRGVLISGYLDPPPNRPTELRFHGGSRVYVRYRKVPLPAGHPARQATQIVDPAAGGGPGGTPGFVQLSLLHDVLLEPVETGLAIDGGYPTGTVSNDQLYVPPPGAAGGGGGAGGLLPLRDLYQVSLRANGPVQGRYSPLGILEVRGAPPTWHGRPDLSSVPLTPHHPDDTVSWFRYDEIEADMFIGYNRYRTFRGYPEDDRFLKNQMLHASGQPIRQVMELKGGGAGFGDYVTISTDDPQVYEQRVRMVYHATERNDGRFFVSLIDCHPQTGVELPGLNLPYSFAYTADMNPRLVKFPSGELPQVGGGRLLFFGDVIDGRGGGSGGFPPDDLEEEIETGYVIDEVRVLDGRNVHGGVPGAPGAGPQGRSQVRHVVVPLESGSVRRYSIGNGLENIGGSIPAGRSISRTNPLEVLIVSIGSDPILFTQNWERGLLAINGEFFFFENPNATQGTTSAIAGGGQQGQGHGTLAGVTGGPAPATGGAATTFQSSAEGLRDLDARMRLAQRIGVQGLSGYFEPEGFARIDAQSAELAGFYEIFYYERLAGGFSNCLRGQFNTAIVNAGTAQVRNVTTRLRLIGRGLLGTEWKTHGFGDRVKLVLGLPVTELTGPMTDTGLPALDTRGFPFSGYLLIDSMRTGNPFEIVAYRGIRGENLFERPRDEGAHGIMRTRFGTVPRPIGPGVFAYAIPFRHFDRYEPETESEDLAYFQKSFRVRGARWRKISWIEREPNNERERLCDIVVAARFDGAPDWSAKPTNAEGGLFVLEAPDSAYRGAEASFDLGVAADELEIRVYFRYKTGSFARVSPDYYRDDWKETPVLEALTVEYEKAGRILRHEESEF